MPEDLVINIPPELLPEQLIRMVLLVLKSHYQRKAEAISHILEGFHEFNEEQLVHIWGDLRNAYPSHAQALLGLSEWIDAQLDGGIAPILPSG